jgi:hypothetical protein
MNMEPTKCLCRIHKNSIERGLLVTKPLRQRHAPPVKRSANTGEALAPEDAELCQMRVPGKVPA